MYKATAAALKTAQKSSQIRGKFKSGDSSDMHIAQYICTKYIYTVYICKIYNVYEHNICTQPSDLLNDSIYSKIPIQFVRAYFTWTYTDNPSRAVHHAPNLHAVPVAQVAREPVL